RQRHRQRNGPVLARARINVDDIIEDIGAAPDAIEIITRRAFALGREELVERAPDEFARRLAERGGGAGIGADDPAFGIERDDAVAGGVEDRFELVIFDVGVAVLTLVGSPAGF